MVLSKIYYGRVTDADSSRMSTYFYDLPSTAARRNAYIYPTSSSAGGPPTRRSRTANGGELRIVDLVEVIESSGMPFGAGSFLYPCTSLNSVCGNIFFVDDECFLGQVGDERVDLTTVVVADLDGDVGREFVGEVVRSLVSCAG